MSSRGQRGDRAAEAGGRSRGDDLSHTTRLLQGFTRDRALVDDALNQIPPHDEEGGSLPEQAVRRRRDYMIRASNPSVVAS